jgi:hypothetical protein
MGDVRCDVRGAPSASEPIALVSTVLRLVCCSATISGAYSCRLKSHGSTLTRRIVRTARVGTHLIVARSSHRCALWTHLTSQVKSQVSSRCGRT